MRIHVSYEKTLPRSDADAEVVVHTAAALARRGHALTLVAPGQPGRPPLSTEDLLAHQGARAPLERFGFLDGQTDTADQVHEKAAHAQQRGRVLLVTWAEASAWWWPASRSPSSLHSASRQQSDATTT